MKLRQTCLLIVLVLLGGTLCRGQTSFVTGGLTAVGTACSTTPPTNTQRIVISNTNFGGATFTLSGTFVGTLGFFGSGDAGNSWQPLGVTPSSGGAAVTTATAPGLWQANVSAYTHLCILTLAYTSGTATARIHVSSISARTGGAGGGGLSLPSGSVPGQSLGVGTSGVVAVSPGLLDGTASPIAGGTYTPVCTTATNTGDRGRVMVITAAANITIPGSGAPGCANSIFYFLLQAAGQFIATTGDTFDVYNGNPPPLTGQTTLSLAAGQYVTVNNGSGTNWHFLVEGPAGGGAIPLSNLTAATAPNTLANAANTQTWNFTDTNNGPSFAIGETAPSTGGVISGNVNGQAILQASTLNDSSATPLSVTQGTLTGVASIPAMQVNATWNNAALAGRGLLINITDTASNTASDLPFAVFGGVSSSFNLLSLNNNGSLTVGGAFTAGSSGSFGLGSAVTAGRFIAQGVGGTTPSFGANSGSVSVAYSGGVSGSGGGATMGSGFFQGGDNSAAISTTQAGSAILRGGFLTGTAGGLTTSAPGTTEIVSGYRVGTIAAVQDVVCGTTTQYQVSDCSTAPQVNIIGIATNTGNPVSVVTYGTIPVRLSAAMTAIGDTVCMSTTTAGQAVDSGGQGNCTTAGAQIGVIVANSGTVYVVNGASMVPTTVTLSTTMPLVQLRFR